MTVHDHDSSSASPYRLLGIMKRDIGPFGLLGVSPDHCDRTAVMRALSNQLARLERHPEGGSEEADRLRRVLQRAADQLLVPKLREAARDSYYGHDTRDIPVDDGNRHPAGAANKNTQQPLSSTPSLADDSQKVGDSYGLKPADVIDRGSPMTATTAAPGNGNTADRRTNFSGAGRDVNDPVDDAIAMAVASAGGWNECARIRVAAVAMQYGISPDDLTERILQSVRLVGVESIESWRHHLPETNQQPAEIRSAAMGINQAAARTNHPARPAHVPTIEPSRGKPSQPVREGLSEEEVEHRSAMRTMTAALITFFIALVLIIPFGIYILYQINTGGVLVTQVDNDGTTTGEADGMSGASAAGAGEMNGSSLPARSTVAKEAMPITFSAALDEVERDIHAQAGLPADVINKYQVLMDQTRHAWVRFDDRSLERIRAFVVSSLYEKGADAEASNAIIEAVDPAWSGQGWSAQSVQPRMWSNAMLTVLSAESGLPAAARRELERHRRRRGGTASAAQDAAPISFHDAAKQSLATVMDAMVRDGVSGGGSVGSGGVGGWGAWKEAVNSLDMKSAERDQLVLQAIYQIMIHTPSMLSDGEARTGVLVLMDEVAWSHSQEGRRSVLAWFNDPQVHADALSVVSGFIVTNGGIPGLDQSFVLPENANSQERAALRTQLARAWKTVSGAGSSGGVAGGVGGGVGGERGGVDVTNWLAHADRALNTPLPEEIEPSLGLLLQTARLNTAASLFEAMNLTEARKVIGSTDLDLLNAQITAELNIRKGTASGSSQSKQSPTVFNNDGEFAFAYAAAVKNNDKDGQQELLDGLLHGRAGDLGEVDSAMLVRLAYRGTPHVMRALAQQVIADRFDNGVAVLLRLADTMSPNEPNGGIARVIEAVTGQNLPDVKSKSWYAEARFALLQHILDLAGTPASSTRIDAVAALLAQSYARRAGLDSSSVSTMTDPADAAKQCFDRWIKRALPMQPVQPVPGTLRDIKRRRETRLYFQDDPIGAFAANQMGILEAVVYVTAAERPALRDQLMGILREAEEKRNESGSAIHQLTAVERAILKVQAVRVRMAWGIQS